MQIEREIKGGEESGGMPVLQMSHMCGYKKQSQPINHRFLGDGKRLSSAG